MNQTQALERLLAAYQRKPERYPADSPRIKVHEVISKVAYVYEKLRNAMEFKEENLLRRNAIERIVKRRVFVENRGPQFAKFLIHELIRGGYVPNNQLPETKIGEVQAVLDKYFALFGLLQLNRLTKEGLDMYRWLFGVASCEIEDVLVSSEKNDALVEFMYHSVGPYVPFEDEGISEAEGKVQLYLAIHRVLIRSDQPILRYHLFGLQNPTWFQPNPNIGETAARMPQIYRQIEATITHPLQERLFRLMKKVVVMFTVLHRIIEQNPNNAGAILSDDSKLAEKVRETCNAIYQSTRAKLTRISVRAIIYIFLTKMLLGLVIELPYDLLFAGSVVALPLVINIVFHPFLMFLVALTIRVPGEKNTEKIIQGIREILRPDTERQIFAKFRKPRLRSRFTTGVFTFLYAITFIVTFGALIALLASLKFSLVSMFVFLFFLTVVSFFGLKIRQNVKELEILDRRDNVVTILVDFFSVPILRVGRWLSTKTPKINILIFFLDFIIEAPFKLFIEVVEGWLSFQREKKEEIY